MGASSSMRAGNRAEQDAISSRRIRSMSLQSTASTRGPFDRRFLDRITDTVASSTGPGESSLGNLRLVPHVSVSSGDGRVPGGIHLSFSSGGRAPMTRMMLLAEILVSMMNTMTLVSESAQPKLTPLSAKSFSKLPTLTFRAESHAPKKVSTSSSDAEVVENSRNTCHVCLDNFSDSDSIVRLPCSHLFHSQCIHQWLCGTSATCPVCRMSLASMDEDNNSASTSDSPSGIPNHPAPSARRDVASHIPDPVSVRGELENLSVLEDVEDDWA